MGEQLGKGVMVLNSKPLWQGLVPWPSQVRVLSLELQMWCSSAPTCPVLCTVLRKFAATGGWLRTISRAF